MMRRVLVYGFLILLLSAATYLVSNDFFDRSHTVAQSIKSGAPNIEDNWSLEEYNLFYDYLAALPDDVDYPMLDSEKSKDIFRNFIESTLSRPQVAVDLFIQMRDMASLQNVCNKILNKYSEKGVENKKYSDELAHIYGIQIKIALDMLKVSYKVITNMDVKDPAYSQNAKGLYYLRKSSSIYISNAVKLISNSRNLQKNRILHKYLKEYGLESFSYMGPELRDRMKQKILEEKTKDKYTKEVLEYIVNNMKTIKA